MGEIILLKKLFVHFVLLILITTGCKNVDAAENSDIVIGIAWRADVDSEFYTNICKVFNQEGIKTVLLDKVVSNAVSYDNNGLVSEDCNYEVGYLKNKFAKKIKKQPFKGSNVASVVEGVDAVIFTGGEDISPTLLKKVTDWHGIQEEIDFNATRDVSDYILMSYCLENDIPIMGYCRGMQMLAVISGGTMISDIPTYFKNKGLTYGYEHRNQKVTPNSYRDYAPHDVKITDKDSIIYAIYGTDTVKNAPSWHHQAVESIEGTNLVITAITPTAGIDMIEAIERTDKSFAIGFQFHPEAAAVKHLEHKINADKFMEYDTAMKSFRYLINYLRRVNDKNQAA